MLGAEQGGEVGVDGPAEGDVTGGQSDAADRTRSRTLSEVMTHYLW